jgi:HD-GYP domain-containing protein (c-di-GMP phosphodiesterase class II)
VSTVKVPQWANVVAQSILAAVKQKDPDTFFHCCRVGQAARQLAKVMGLSEFEQVILEFSGLFHDVGKMGVPDDILLKPAKLTAKEIEIMKSHPELSVQIIKPLLDDPFFRFLVPGIRYHHEKIDGTGYPHKLAGNNIPLPARIVAIVDTVDAMTQSRPYRPGQPMEKVTQELIDFSDRQFDKHLVKIYLEALRFKNKKPLTAEDEEQQITTQLLKVA